MNTIEYKEENQPWAARPSSGCELSRHSAKTVWATESRGTVQCKMPSGNIVEICAAGDSCAAPKGTWREIEARLDPEWRSVFNREASFSALGQISTLCATPGISAREEAQPSRFSSELPGACVCLPAVVPGTKVDINNVVERKKERRKGAEGSKTGADGVRQEGEKGMREKGRNKHGQVVKNQKKSEELSGLQLWPEDC